MNKKVCAVVVWYNPTVDMVKNIDSYKEKIDKLWIIDNSNYSNKNFLNMIEIESIKYVFNKKNVGIAKALNIAGFEAYKEKYKWLLTMDQDSKFSGNSFDKLLEFIEKAEENVGIVSPYHKLKGKKNTLENEFEEKKIVMTSGNLINLNIFNDLGGFNEEFFIDEVDHEYCYRLGKVNKKIIVLKNSELEHNLGDIKEYNFLGKKIITTNHSPIRRYYMMRNRLYIMKKYKELRFFYSLVIINSFIKILIFEKEKIEKVKYMFKGIHDYRKGIKNEYKKN